MPARGVALPNGMPSPNWLYSVSGPWREALLVAQFHAGEIEHAVLHGAEHLLAAAGADALVERADDAEREMQAGAAIADLRAGDQRRPVAEAGGRGRAAGALRHVLVDLAVLVRARAKTLHRGDDHARIELVDVLPGQPHAVERAGGKILHQHVAFLDQPVEDFLALGVLGVDRDRALRTVEHGEIEAVLPFHVAQLAARDVADAGPLHLDAIGAHIGEQLRAGRPRLHMGEVEDFHAFERPARLAPRLCRRPRQAVAVALLLAPPASSALSFTTFLADFFAAAFLTARFGFLALGHCFPSRRSLDCRCSA